MIEYPPYPAFEIARAVFALLWALAGVVVVVGMDWLRERRQ